MTVEIALEMPMAMQQNEVILFVDLSEIQGFSPVAAISELQSLGYSPDLRLYSWKTHEKEGVNPCALLHREISDDPESVLSSLEPVHEKLANIFGDEAIYLAMGGDD